MPATLGTAEALHRADIAVDRIVAKLGESSGNGQADPVELISSGEVGLVINTPRGSGPRTDGHHIRTAALANKVACVTTMSAARAAVSGIAKWAGTRFKVVSIQEYHSPVSQSGASKVRYN